MLPLASRVMVLNAAELVGLQMRCSRSLII